MVQSRWKLFCPWYENIFISLNCRKIATAQNWPLRASSGNTRSAHDQTLDLAKQANVNRAFTTIKAALTDKEVAETLATLGLEVAPSASPEEFTRQVKAEQELWAPYVKRIGFSADS